MVRNFLTKQDHLGEYFDVTLSNCQDGLDEVVTIHQKDRTNKIVGTVNTFQPELDLLINVLLKVRDFKEEPPKQTFDEWYIVAKENFFNEGNGFLHMRKGQSFMNFLSSTRPDLYKKVKDHQSPIDVFTSDAYFSGFIHFLKENW